MGLFKKFFNQTRKPAGVLGNLMIGRMNVGHAKLSEWGRGFLPYGSVSEIVELGCGGGHNVFELLKKYPSASAVAVDYSPLSVKRAKKYNKKFIKSGRCEVLEGDVSALPFESDRFSLATAFETVYFWPDLEECFAGVLRILKPGGTFMIVNESDGADENSLYMQTVIDGMRTYTEQQIEQALKNAGFAQVKTEHHAENPWITVVAEKAE